MVVVVVVAEEVGRCSGAVGTLGEGQQTCGRIVLVISAIFI